MNFNGISYFDNRGLKIMNILKYGCTFGGLLGIIFGSVACYLQEGGDNETVFTPRKFVESPNVKSIQVITNEE